MSAPTPLFKMSLGLSAALVALILGCGGGVVPVANTTESKMVGWWEADPAPPTGQVDKALVKHISRSLNVTYAKKFGDADSPPALSGELVEKLVLHTAAGVAVAVGETLVEGLDVNDTTTHRIPRLAVNGLAASASPGQWNFDGNEGTGDGSIWILRLDANDPGVLDLSWEAKGGVKLLSEVKFRRKK